MPDQAYVTALEYFEMKWDRQHKVHEPQLPYHPGTVHAHVRPQRIVEPLFYDDPHPKVALCGTPVRVLSVQAFPPADPDACPRCAELASTGFTPPRDPREDRWAERDRRRWEKEKAETELILWRQRERAAGRLPPDENDDRLYPMS